MKQNKLQIMLYIFFYYLYFTDFLWFILLCSCPFILQKLTHWCPREHDRSVWHVWSDTFDNYLYFIIWRVNQYLLLNIKSMNDNSKKKSCITGSIIIHQSTYIVNNRKRAFLTRFVWVITTREYISIHLNFPPTSGKFACIKQICFKCNTYWPLFVVITC